MGSLYRWTGLLIGKAPNAVLPIFHTPNGIVLDKGGLSNNILTRKDAMDIQVVQPPVVLVVV